MFLTDSPWLVLQHFSNGDLKNFLTVSNSYCPVALCYDSLYPAMQNNERTIEQLIKYMIDVAMGMHYINEHGLVHRVS